MDGAVLAIFIVSSLFGGIVSGVAGFAMGLVVSGIWLHLFTPAQFATLIVSYGLVTQCYGIWKLRHALRWRMVAPFVIGGLGGVPLGAALLAYIDPDYLRAGVGVLLIVYSSYSLARPHIRVLNSSFAAETGIGFLNGILGGMTGLAGPIITMWCQLRGWSKDVQRTVYQPVILASFILTLASQAVAGTITPDLVRIYLYGLPPLLVGLFIGLKLYGRLDEAAFRKTILFLLLLSGLALILPFVVPR